jgi:dienelactone hydrolase
MSCFSGLPPVDEEAFAILAQFYEYDRDLPLNGRVLYRKENEAYKHEKFVIRGLHNSRIPGYLTIPTPGLPPYPCILIVHGAGGSKEERLELGSEETSITKALISAGFAVLALDGPHHGERSADVDYESSYSYARPNIYRELIVQWAVEHRMALDYLADRSEIEITRVGMLGYSLGGVVVFPLAGVESRIKAAVTAVTSPLSRFYLNQRGWDENALLNLAPIAPQVFAPMIKNTPFLMLNGKMDTWGILDEVAELFEAISSPTKELAIFDCGHNLPDDHMAMVVEWFIKHLK